MSIEDTLKERGNAHGDFTNNARVMCELVDDMVLTPNWDKLMPDQRVALTYIAGKISRILCGDHNHKDHWHDIAGYAKLVEERLQPALSPTYGGPKHCLDCTTIGPLNHQGRCIECHRRTLMDTPK